ncbi:MAG: rhodanese-like domain-containing protein [Candidatus Competibacteraceae bacterium]|nr:rhodanese-like domain-containing protein [Candidatus Competibacteraceae bacterium]
MNRITVVELKALMDQGCDFQLIDVRESYERDFCHIGGELIPLGDVLENTHRIHSNKQVIIYCRTGVRSATLISVLQTMGYSNLYNLEGGIVAWSKEIDSTVPIY